MTGSSIGQIFRVTTWGESHGEAIGCVIEGVPPKLSLTEDYIQKFLDRRKPGQSKFTTQRKEEDKVKILSGVFKKKTTGTPISLIIYNSDQKSKDYEDIKNKFRPGHADFTYQMKYGIRDYRGGGRASARETAMRVAAGAVAQKILGKKIKIKGALIQIGNKKINNSNWDWDEVNNNNLFCPDSRTLPIWERYLRKVRKEGSSIGAVIQINATGVQPGLGEPIFSKIDALIAQGMMSIPAVKGVEIGNGFKSAELRGEENADEIRSKNKQIIFESNNSGGTLGGITSGQDIIVKFAVKPTSSILNERKTVDLSKKNTSIITKGRHDPCVGIRAVPVGEAMLSIILADCYLLQKKNKI